MEQAKEAVEEMYRNVVDFLKTNMEVVNDKIGQMVESMEDDWDNMVDEHFNGENEAALQVVLAASYLGFYSSNWQPLYSDPPMQASTCLSGTVFPFNRLLSNIIFNMILVQGGHWRLSPPDVPRPGHLPVLRR